VTHKYFQHEKRVLVHVQLRFGIVFVLSWALGNHLSKVGQEARRAASLAESNQWALEAFNGMVSACHISNNKWRAAAGPQSDTRASIHGHTSRTRSTFVARCHEDQKIPSRSLQRAPITPVCCQTCLKSLEWLAQAAGLVTSPLFSPYSLLAS
jgi:hypothetical protein